MLGSPRAPHARTPGVAKGCRHVTWRGLSLARVQRPPQGSNGDHGETLSRRPAGGRARRLRRRWSFTSLHRTGRPLSSNRLCPRSHRCTGFKKRDTTEAALLARAASGLSLVAGERGGLISSRTARGVRVNLVLAMVFQRHVRRKAVLFPATRAQAAEAGLMLHKLASSWLRGEASMDSYCLRAG